MNNIEELIYNIYNLQCHKKTSYFNRTKFTSEVGSPTYGEITVAGVDIILKTFNDYFNKDTVFYDLGCGMGKMVFHIGIKTNIKKLCGIEYSKERYQACIDIQQQDCSNLNNIHFINESFFDVDISDANIIYIDNTAITSKELLSSIWEMIPKNALVIHQTTFPDQESTILHFDSQITTYGKKYLNYFTKD